jgi:NitT/TauT family transport system ATP-binding protein
MFPLSLMGKVDAAARERARNLLALVGLEGFENHQPHQLSGGMQQRVAICRGLIHDPAVLLMDEPFGALDALTREEIGLQLLRLWEERPKTIVFVTHSIPEAVLLADRILVMSPRPGRALDRIDVGLPRPRSFDMESDDEFQSCTRRLRRHIFGRPGRPARSAPVAEAVL